MLRILSIDPSGTGTTGICLIDNNKITFQGYRNQEWEVHLNFLISEIETYKPAILLYENTHYINSKGKDMTSLLKLIGSIEGLAYTFDFIEQIDSILVGQVKDLKSKLLKGTKKLPELEFKPGRGKGWMFNQKKISLHELDAYLVYWLWKEKNNAN